jgi:hypothetical protein
MTRRKVLRVDAELHDGQRLQVFNVHQATSGDMQLQQHTWQVLAKSIMECPHQRILLGEKNANGLRVGYAVSNTEHMRRVDELLTKFVHDTKGELMSPSTVSWKRGDKGAKLDHIIISWNLPHDSNAGPLGACWFRIAPQVLAHTRKYCPRAEGTKLIRLKDWHKTAPALQRELGGEAEATLAKVRAGTVDVSTAVQDTLRSRNQLARSWMAPTIRSRWAFWSLNIHAVSI